MRLDIRVRLGLAKFCFLLWFSEHLRQLHPIANAPKPKGKKKVATTTLNVPVGGQWLDVAMTNILALCEEEWQ